MTQYVGLDVSLKETKLQRVLMRQASGYGAADAPAEPAAMAAAVGRGVGEVIPVASLRPIRTAHKTLGDHTLERPSCGGFMPTAETTLIPAYSAN